MGLSVLVLDFQETDLLEVRPLNSSESLSSNFSSYAFLAKTDLFPLASQRSYYSNCCHVPINFDLYNLKPSYANGSAYLNPLSIVTDGNTSEVIRTKRQFFFYDYYAEAGAVEFYMTVTSLATTQTVTFNVLSHEKDPGEYSGQTGPFVLGPSQTMLIQHDAYESSNYFIEVQVLDRQFDSTPFYVSFQSVVGSSLIYYIYLFLFGFGLLLCFVCGGTLVSRSCRNCYRRIRRRRPNEQLAPGERAFGPFVILLNSVQQRNDIGALAALFSAMGDDSRPGPVLRQVNEDNYAIRRETIPEDQTCVVCMDYMRIIRFAPCEHVCCCEWCALAVRQQNDLCPLCRTQIEDMDHIDHGTDVETGLALDQLTVVEGLDRGRVEQHQAGSAENLNMTRVEDDLRVENVSEDSSPLLVGIEEVDPLIGGGGVDEEEEEEGESHVGDRDDDQGEGGNH